MKVQLIIEELGTVLKTLDEKYDLTVLIKSVLSGGWMTITGKCEVIEIPEIKAVTCGGKGNNIISIKINEESGEGNVVKITGAKGKSFDIDISAARYREIPKSGLALNMIKTSETESKLKVDENIIFTVKENYEKLIEFLNIKK